MIKDLSIQAESQVPKILIIHSHTHENYEMNKGTKQIGSVVDVEDELAKVLEKNYKVSVLYDKGEYDTVNGKVYMAGAYDCMEIEVKKILQENSSIEVIIDIHRDGGIEPSATLINKVSTSKINIINGLSMDESIGEIGSLKQYSNATF